MEKFVTYRRVSTKSQGKSGLGLEAQDRDIRIFLESYAETPFEVLGTFTDIQSGSLDDRPLLAEAMALAKREGATLLVAKLDRLSRSVAFIAGLLDDKRLRLRVASMPSADKFQLHIYAALAEQEREFISLRTKAALAEAKARGVKLGGIRGSTEKRNAALKAQADTFAAKVRPMAASMRDSGHSYAQIAQHLNETGVKTARGGLWYATTVRNLLERAA